MPAPKPGTPRYAKYLADRREKNMVTLTTCANPKCGFKFAWKSFKVYSMPNMDFYEFCSVTCKDSMAAQLNQKVDKP